MTKEEFITQVKAEQNALRGFLLALCCGNKEDADDVLQDSLVKAYLALGHYSDSGRFHSWIFRIAFNTFLNHRACARPHAALEEAWHLGFSADNFEHQPLYLALAALPPRERSAVTLYYLNGYSIKEIAGISDCSIDAVKKQLSRGREKLKESIKP